MRAADGLINTTPVGMASHPGTPLPPEMLRPDLWVAEIIYSAGNRASRACSGARRPHARWRRHGRVPGC